MPQAPAKRRSSIPTNPTTVVEVPIDWPQPSPENESVLYKPVRADDPEIIKLSESMAEYGQKEPLVLTRDGFIVSGHRRHCAARLAGFKTMDTRFEQYRRADDIDQHVLMLREHNRQRDKSDSEKVREEIVSADPEEAYRVIVEHRQQQSAVDVEPIDLRGRKTRSGFSTGTTVFVEKVVSVLNANRAYVPFSLRRLHYLLVSEETWRYKTAKRQTPYGNDRQSYQALSNVLTRMRLAGMVPHNWIDDETRPEHYCRVYDNPREFLRDELDNFGKGFYRDLMQSQPNYFHIHAEKNTILPIIKDIANEYTIRVTSGRGYSSLPPRRRIQQQFLASGKERLVLLMLSDFDPEGEDIIETFARSLRDDFGIRNITPVKVGLTVEQRDEYDLPPEMTAKTTSSRHDAFVQKHGESVWEIEALPANALQEALRRTIDSLIDVEAFNREIDREKEDAAFLDDFRRQWMHQAREEGIDFEDGD